MASAIWPVVVALLACCVPKGEPPAIEAPLSIERGDLGGDEAAAGRSSKPAPPKPTRKPSSTRPVQIKPPAQALNDAIRSAHALRDALDRYHGPRDPVRSDHPEQP